MALVTFAQSLLVKQPGFTEYVKLEGVALLVTYTPKQTQLLGKSSHI